MPQGRQPLVVSVPSVPVKSKLPGSVSEHIPLQSQEEGVTYVLSRMITRGWLSPR